MTFPAGSSSRREILQSWKRRLQGFPKTPHVSLLSLFPLADPLSISKLQVILFKGADLNSRQCLRSNAHFATAWQIILAKATIASSLNSEIHEGGRLNISNCMRLLIDHGADISRSSVNQACKLCMDRGDAQEKQIREEVYQALKRLTTDKQSSFRINRYYEMDRNHKIFLLTNPWPPVAVGGARSYI